MQDSNINIEPNKDSFNYQVYLLFIPAVIFVAIIAFVVKATSNQAIDITQAQTLNTPSQLP